MLHYCITLRHIKWFFRSDCNLQFVSLACRYTRNVGRIYIGQTRWVVFVVIERERLGIDFLVFTSFHFDFQFSLFSYFRKLTIENNREPEQKLTKKIRTGYEQKPNSERKRVADRTQNRGAEHKSKYLEFNKHYSE